MSNCRRVAHDLTELQEGELPLHRRALLRFHLLICPSCKVYVKQMHTTVEALREVDEPLAEDAGRELAKKLLAKRAKPDD